MCTWDEGIQPINNFSSRSQLQRIRRRIRWNRNRRTQKPILNSVVIGRWHVVVDRIRKMSFFLLFTYDGQIWFAVPPSEIVTNLLSPFLSLVARHVYLLPSNVLRRRRLRRCHSLHLRLRPNRALNCKNSSSKPLSLSGLEWKIELRIGNSKPLSLSLSMWIGREFEWRYLKHYIIYAADRTRVRRLRLRWTVENVCHGDDTEERRRKLRVLSKWIVGFPKLPPRDFLKNGLTDQTRISSNHKLQILFFFGVE